MIRFVNHLNVLVFCSIQSVYAQNTIECDRPDQTETPSVVPHNHFQMETGFYYTRSSKYEKEITHPAALLKYGMKDIAELRVEIESATSVDNSEIKQNIIYGLKPLALGLKLKICEEKKWRPRTSVIVMTSIPVLASAKFREKYPSPEVRLVFQHTISKQFSFSYNLGAFWDGDNFNTTGLYTVTVGYVMADNWGCYLELYGFIPHRQRSSNFIDGGITFTPCHNVMIDVSAGVSIDKRQPEFWSGFGVSFRLPN
ncbi:MAG: transporter [Chitinophagales bacterium]